MNPPATVTQARPITRSQIWCTHEGILVSSEHSSIRLNHGLFGRQEAPKDDYGLVGDTALLSALPLGTYVDTDDGSIVYGQHCVRCTASRIAAVKVGSAVHVFIRPTRIVPHLFLACHDLTGS